MPSAWLRRIFPGPGTDDPCVPVRRGNQYEFSEQFWQRASGLGLVDCPGDSAGSERSFAAPLLPGHNQLATHQQQPLLLCTAWAFNRPTVRAFHHTHSQPVRHTTGADVGTRSTHNRTASIRAWSRDQRLPFPLSNQSIDECVSTHRLPHIPLPRSNTQCPRALHSG